jgi:ribosome recycling factor
MADVTSALSEATDKMNKAVEVAKDDFGAIRTGRAHPAMFNKIMVDYYGTYTPLSQLASIQIPESRMAIISPFDKGASASIEKAIRESDLGVNPASDGAVIRAIAVLRQTLIFGVAGSLVFADGAAKLRRRAAPLARR